MSDTTDKNYHCFNCDAFFTRESVLRNGQYTVYYLEKGSSIKFRAYGFKCMTCHSPLNLKKQAIVISYHEGKEDIAKAG